MTENWYFWGVFAALAILSSWFAYRKFSKKKKEDTKDKPEDSSEINTKKPKWPFVLYLSMIIGFPLIAYEILKWLGNGLISLIEKASDWNIHIPNWVITLFLVALFIVGMIYFWKFISKKAPTVHTAIKTTAKSIAQWKLPKWVRSVLTFAIIVALLWFIVLPHMRHWNWVSTSHDNATAAVTNDRPMQVINASSKQYPKLNTSGSNKMKKGAWKKFSIRRDGDPLWFTPAIAKGDTLTYYFKKVEDETRTWAVQAWIGLDGEPVEKHITPDEPYPEAQLGECLVSTDRDVVVVVKTKKTK